MFSKIRDKRGVALELAIVMLITMFSLCTALYIAAFRQYLRDNTGNRTISAAPAVEQFGENFYYRCKLGDFESLDANTFKPVGYLATLRNDNYKKEYTYIIYKEVVTVDEEENETVENVTILEVRVNYKDEENIVISKWYFFNENNDETYLNIVDDELEGEKVWD